MNSLRDNKLLLPSALVFLAAIVFAGSLFWYGMRSTNNDTGGASVYHRPTIANGQKNPADALPRMDSQRVSGIVTNVNADSVSISNTPPPPADVSKTVPIEQSQTFKVDQSTVIYAKGALKDQETINKEMKEFNEALAYADAGDNTIYVAPEPFVRIPLRLSDLKAGMSVLVRLDATNAKAVSIFVMQYPTSP